ncbi:hypothetical protein FBU30_001356 [Linnemannia zychae]|nr:hypothetical protein FBU30_001356 [Linnemannia zychae]
MVNVTARGNHGDAILLSAYSPDGKYIMTAGNDGQGVKIHTHTENDISVNDVFDFDEETLDVLCASNDHLFAGTKTGMVKHYDLRRREMMGAVTRCDLPVRALAVSPNGRLLAIGTEAADIKIIDTEDIEQCWSARGHKKAVNNLAFDPLGNFLLSSSCDGTVIVWDVKSRENKPHEIIHVSEPTATTSEKSMPLIWHPTGEFFVVGKGKDILAYHRHTWKKSFTYRSGSQSVDTAGTLSTWDNVVDSEKGSPFGQPKPDPLDGLFDDTAAEDHIMQDEDMARDVVSDNESLHDFIVDDENGDYLKEKSSTGKSGATRGITFGSVKAMQPIKTLHPRFQSGSTSAIGQRRYLAFNLLGLITYVDHSDHCTIVVEFHDKVTSRGFRFSDNSKFTLAYLGANGALFAARATDDNPSTVYYKTHDSSLSKSEWRIYLPPGEDVTSIALTGNSAIVATSRGFVRIFSQSGVQTNLYSVGSIVSIAGFHDLAVIIYHQGEPFEGSQNLGYLMYNVSTNQRIQRGSLPVSDDTTVTWLGFSEYGVPAFYDDSGVVHVLNHYRRIDQGQWVPILDTNFLESDPESGTPTYWPIGLTDQSLTCIKCRKGETEPSFPKPFVTELPLRMPTLYQETDTGIAEEEWLRQKLLVGLCKDEKLASTLEQPSMSVARREIEMDKLILQMIRTACSTGFGQKSLDLASMLCNSRSVDGAIKIAYHFNMSQLTERFQIIRDVLVRAEEDGLEADKDKVMADDIIDVSPRKDERIYNISSRREEEELERTAFERKDAVKANDPFGRRIVKSNSTNKSTANGNGSGTSSAAANPFKKKAGSGATGTKGFGNIMKEADRNTLPITRRATDVFEAADYLAADEQRLRIEKEKAANRQDDIFRKRKANGATTAMTSGGQKTLNMFNKQSSTGSSSDMEAKRFKKQQTDEQDDEMMVEDDFLEDNGYEDREESFPPAAQVIPETQREEEEEDDLFALSVEETRGHLANTRVESSLSPDRNSSSVLAGFKFNRPQ